MTLTPCDKLSADRQDNAPISLRPVEFFSAVGSGSGGDQYKLLERRLDRLRNTRVTTNANPYGKRGIVRRFNWLESVAKTPEGWVVGPAAWVHEGAQSDHILEISPDYFDMSSGLERFVYLIARKHTGGRFGRVFSIGCDTLYRKSGSASAKARFKFELRKVAQRNALPDYTVRWCDRGRGKDAIIEISKDGMRGQSRAREG